jgi:hypothetical protein
MPEPPAPQTLAVLAGGEVVRDRAQVRVLGRVAIDHLETARTRRVPIERGGHH